ncbi:MAG: F0F1 ATP synthase subunit A [Leptospiraceae bacterium]|nr:F0F1 ATP synthase subunit A [Leptospiraceae bacterium]
MPKRIISSILLITMLTGGAVFAETEGHDTGVEHGTEHHGEEKFDLQKLLVHHLMDSVIIEWQPGGTRVYEDENPEAFNASTSFKRYTFRDEEGRLYKYEGGLPMHITRRVSMMFIVAILILAIFIPAARKIASNPQRVQGRFAGAVEAIINYLRKDVAEANMHHPTPGYIGYVITSFLFILFCNLLGLFPPFGEMVLMAKNLVMGNPIAHHAAIGETDPALLMIWPGITVTGDIAVTMSLAGITTLLIWVAGFHYQGYKFIWHSVPAGVPFWLYPLLWPIEFIIGPIAKGFALTMRLLANMTAGHVLLLVIAGFIFQVQTWWMPIISVSGMTALYVLELLVAVLQAFIFSLLSAIFIGLSMHRH